MTFPDPQLDRPIVGPGATPGSRQDIVPPTERGQDPAREGAENDLTRDPARPLSSAEKAAAEHDTMPGERVFAPASERVPKEPVPGHRDVVQHTDTHTLERAAAAGGGSSTVGDTEPAFARMPRPTASGVTGAYASPASNPGLADLGSWSAEEGQASGSKRRLFLGIGAGWTMVIAGGAATFLYLRWRRERNKPINRLRRQAQQAVSAAADLRDRLPDTEDATRPAVGLGTALLSIMLLLWRQSRAATREPRQVLRDNARSARSRAAHAVDDASDALPDVDWYRRLNKLKERWSPSRVELEKISISRHR